MDLGGIVRLDLYHDVYSTVMVNRHAVYGQVTLVLDDGEERTVSEPGTVIVQRGTMHTWVNRSNTWARYVIVVVDALPTTVRAPSGGQKTLPEGIKSS